MSCTAVLLAGGRSRRMGEDKAFIAIGDPPQPLWRRQLAILETLGADELLLSHNAEQTFDVPDGVHLIEDAKDNQGPLGGLASCLRESKNGRLLVLAIDLPFVTSEFLKVLLSGNAGLVLRDETSGRYEPVVTVYTADCLAIAEKRLKNGELAMQSFIGECVRAGLLIEKVISDTHRPLLKNWNRPEDIS